MPRHAALLCLLAAHGAYGLDFATLPPSLPPSVLGSDEDWLSSAAQLFAKDHLDKPLHHEPVPFDLHLASWAGAPGTYSARRSGGGGGARPQHRRLLQDAAAAPGPAGAPSQNQTQAALDDAISQRRFLPLERVCKSYKPGQAGGFVCRLEEISLDRRDIYAHIVAWTVPASVAGAPPLDTFIRLESVEGDADLIVQHSASRIAKLSLRAHTTDRVRLHAADLPAGSMVAVLVGTETHDTLYNLEIEAVASRQKIAAPDLQALREVARACCTGAACRLDPWPQLAAEAAAPPAGGGTAQRICELDTVHCDADGHVIELSVEESGWQCGVQALAPLGALPRLQALRLVGVQAQGEVSALFAHFAGGSLHQLHLFSMPLTGSLDAACGRGGLFSQPMFRDFAAIDVGVSGAVPGCVWELHGFMAVQTRLAGPLPAATPSAITRSLLLHGGAGVGSPAVSATNLDLSNAKHLRVLALERVAVSGTLTVPRRVERVLVTETAVTGLRVAPEGPPAHLHRVTLHKTALSGTLPRALLELPELLVFNASDSRLEALPEAWSAPKLSILDVSRNNIKRSVLPALAAQPVLAAAFISGNGMEGPVGALVEALKSRATTSGLVQLWAKDNAFTGAVPAALVHLGVWAQPRRVFSTASGLKQELLHILDFENNNLSGDVPDALYDSRSPSILADFSGNEAVTCRPRPEFTDTTKPRVVILCDGNSAAFESRDPVQLVGNADDAGKRTQSAAEDAEDDGGGGGGGGGKRAAAVAVPVVVVLVLAAAGLAAWWRQRQPAAQTGQFGTSAIVTGSQNGASAGATGDTVDMPAQEVPEA